MHFVRQILFLPEGRKISSKKKCDKNWFERWVIFEIPSKKMTFFKFTFLEKVGACSFWSKTLIRIGMLVTNSFLFGFAAWSCKLTVSVFSRSKDFFGTRSRWDPTWSEYCSSSKKSFEVRVYTISPFTPEIKF